MARAEGHSKHSDMEITCQISYTVVTRKPSRPPTPQTSSINQIRFRNSFLKKNIVTVLPEKDGKWKIIVCDDSPVSRKSTSRILKLEGHYVDEADNGSECLFMIQLAKEYLADEYDTVVLDDDMPVMSGHECVRLLRAKGYDKLIVIGLTGSTNDEHLQTMRDNGCDLVERKPMTQALWKRIYNSLNISDAEERSHDTS